MRRLGFDSVMRTGLTWGEGNSIERGREREGGREREKHRGEGRR